MPNDKILLFKDICQHTNSHFHLRRRPLCIIMFYYFQCYEQLTLYARVFVSNLML